MNLVNVTDNILLVKGINEGRFPHSHSVLILDEDVVLIDTGCGIEVLEQIKRRFNISYVINSHTHPDHSAGNWVFKNSPIYVPEEGFKTSGNLRELSVRFVGKKLAKYWREFIKKNLEFKNCEPTNSYFPHTVFDFGSKKLKAIFTPGHTNDHYCFFEPQEKILFSFDYDLTSFPWYGHIESSIQEFSRSVFKLKALSPELVVSSHRGLIKEKIGQLEVGYSADLIGLDMNSPNLRFSKDIYSAITMRAEPSDIVFQMFKGKIIKWKDQK